MPPLLKLKSEKAYRNHYVRSLCSQHIETHDGIHVTFNPYSFEYAFYESTHRRGANDVFSWVRAKTYGLDCRSAGRSKCALFARVGQAPPSVFSETTNHRRRSGFRYSFVVKGKE